MQYARTEQQTLTQTDLFHNALMATRLKHHAFEQPVHASPQEDEPDGSYSEMTLQGSARQCLQWLAPVLRELSQKDCRRWLTLIDPPASVSQQWLRGANLDPQRIMIVRSKAGMDSLKLCCDLLKMGGSHTVVSWLDRDSCVAPRLERAAQVGRCQSLNVHLG
ncbi:SOS-induced cell division inhibitor SulA [Halopseudomonas sp.]|uniref:SOS-induced cell division inhibitor SulA n=1 Tax=Halopseudomonas sp. TaxID=2901191 RepID=UPI00311D40A9